MLRVALTGGIASGKSAAANVFAELGVPVIHTDRIAREVVETGSPGLQRLVESFGDEILHPSGDLDRARLRQLIFENKAARQKVNEVLHPLILAEVERQIEKLASESQQPYVVVEIPLLTETRLAAEFDRVLVVDASEQAQMERLRARDGATKQQAEAALASQSSRDERLAAATDVIDNSGSLEELDRKVRRLHARYLELAKGFASPSDRPSE